MLFWETRSQTFPNRGFFLLGVIREAVWIVLYLRSRNEASQAWRWITFLISCTSFDLDETVEKQQGVFSGTRTSSLFTASRWISFPRPNDSNQRISGAPLLLVLRDKCDVLSNYMHLFTFRSLMFLFGPIGKLLWLEKHLSIKNVTFRLYAERQTLDDYL